MDSQDLQETNSGRASRRSKATSPTKQSSDTISDLLSVSVTSKAFNIYVVKKGASNVASFALTNTGASSTGGVTFVFPPTYSGTVTVTFVLGAGITSLSSQTLNFSAVVNNQQTLQLTAPSSSSSDASGYSFLVNFSAGGSHDPHIIVSPIGGQPGNQKAKPAKAAAKRKPAPKVPAKAKAKAPAKAKRGNGPARKNKR